MEVRIETGGEEPYVMWPVAWSAIWVGTLTALAVGLVIGLAGVALGAQQAQADMATGRMGLGTLIFAVVGAFFSFVAGGWVATRIAGIWRSETAVLHGSVVWLVGVPVLLAMAALGAGSLFGAWFHGLAGLPAWATAPAMAPDPREVRNSALGAITMLLLGLTGSVLGAWLGAAMNEAALQGRRMVGPGTPPRPAPAGRM